MLWGEMIISAECQKLIFLTFRISLLILPHGDLSQPAHASIDHLIC